MLREVRFQLTDLDFESLRMVHRKERNVANLTEVPEDFYEALSVYINHLYEETSDSHDLGKLRLLENSVKVARDVFQRRLQKIVARALKAAKTDESSDEYMTPEEKRLYSSILENLEEYKNFFESVVSGKYMPIKGNESEEKSTEGPHDEEAHKESENPSTEMLINETAQNLVLARIIKAIPRFVATDGKEYGPYEPEDIVRLPEEVADILGEQGLVEIL